MIIDEADSSQGISLRQRVDPGIIPIRPASLLARNNLTAEKSDE
jgi:hypothetical protein